MRGDLQKSSLSLSFSLSSVSMERERERERERSLQCSPLNFDKPFSTSLKIHLDIAILIITDHGNLVVILAIQSPLICGPHLFGKRSEGTLSGRVDCAITYPH